MIIDTVKGDLIALFKQGNGHLIHGCNCFHTYGRWYCCEDRRKSSRKR